MAGAAGALLLRGGGRERDPGRARDVGRARRWRRGSRPGWRARSARSAGRTSALAYADRSGPELRATISLAFAVGVVLSLFAVWVAGEVEAAPVELGLALVPATFAGLWRGAA